MPPAKRQTKRTTTRPVPERNHRIAAFEEFRRRASPTPAALEREPYRLGPENGFDPEIVVGYPSSLEALDALDRAYRMDDYLTVLRVLLGGDYQRVLRQFDAYATEHDETPWPLLSGLADVIADHFLGRGAADVPGGTRAS